MALARNHRLSKMQLREPKLSYGGTKIRSEPLGVGTSKVEVTNISTYGVWLLAGDQEFFLSYEDFPGLKDTPVCKIVNVEEPTPGHFYWPALDIDLGLRTTEHPERFPLKTEKGSRRSDEPSVIRHLVATPAPHDVDNDASNRRS